MHKANPSIRSRPTALLLSAIGAAGVFTLTGCTSKHGLSTTELREALLNEHRAKLEGRAEEIQLEQTPSVFETSLERVLEQAKKDGINLPEDRDTVEENLAAADKLSGADAYEGVDAAAGEDLLGNEELDTVVLDLQSASRKAVEHNLDLAVARRSPQISDEQIRQARAAFDFTLFGSATQTILDTPRPPLPPGGGIAGLAADQQSRTTTLVTGIRKDLRTGGRLTAQASVQRLESTPTFFGANRFYDADVLLQLEQPLLRGFGSDVAEANIELAGIAKQADLANLKLTLLDLALSVERAYWQLSAARQTLLIQQRLYERTIAIRDRLEPRFGTDLLLADLNEVNARIDQRYADVLRARQNVRSLSDTLKRLINDPDLSVISETVLEPSDTAADVAISFSLLDQVTTALQNRPEISTALLAIDDIEVRRVVADNAQLPVLNLVASTTFNGLDVNNAGDALGATTDLDYIDYAVGLEFERPFGNRSARSLFDQQTLEKQQALKRYRSTAQVVTLEVKDALRSVDTNYQLITTTRSQRRASALSLEVADIQLDRGGRNENESFTVRVDRVLQRQDALAQAEQAEVQALSDYMVSLSELKRATGTLLNEAGVEVEDGE